jgi:hypothetical protein
VNDLATELPSTERNVNRTPILAVIATLSLVACDTSPAPTYYAGPERVSLEQAEAYCEETGGRDAYPDPFADGPKYCWTGAVLVRDGVDAQLLMSPVGQVLPEEYDLRLAIPLCVVR